eukprot:2176508-Amphidinium_carterae.1
MLGFNWLAGTMPPATFWMTNLRVLVLDTTCIEGTISDCISRLQRLTHISLANTGIQGAIPTATSHTHSLNTFFLAGARFEGYVPSFANRNIARIALSLIGCPCDSRHPAPNLGM